MSAAVSFVGPHNKPGFFSIDTNKLVETTKKVAYPLIILVGCALTPIGVFNLAGHAFTYGFTYLAAGILTIAYGLLNIKSAYDKYSIFQKQYNLLEHPFIKLCDRKWFCHVKLIGSRINEIVDFLKIGLNLRSKVANQNAFPEHTMILRMREGGFKYDGSSPDVEQWTANFADYNLFGYAHTELLAQDELQVLEHPGLYHLKHAIGKSAQLKKDQVALIKGVKRRGELSGLYGADFARADASQIDSKLKKFSDPAPSNIFAMAAPIAPKSSKGLPYSKSDLEKLFYRSQTAFKAIKDQTSKKVECHTGNWGAGAFGGSARAAAVCQIAAARHAGVDELVYYPMDKALDFAHAKLLLDQIENEYPDMSVDELLSHLAENAQRYDLVYGESNNT